MSLIKNKVLYIFYWLFREVSRICKKFNILIKAINKKSKLPKGLVSECKIKKVAFFVGCPDNRSERYRVDNITEELEKRNVYVDRYFEFELKKLFENPNYDILVIFRANKSKHNLLNNVISLFKSRNIPVVYDTDDLIFNKDVIEDFATKNNFEDYQISRLMTNADLYKELLMSCNFATTTTQYLANQIEKQCGIKTFVIKNTINSKQFELAKKLNKKNYKTTNKIKICYLSGTATHNKDFKEVEPVLLRILAENKNVEFHIVGPLLLNEKFNKFKNQIKRKRYMHYLKLLRYSADMDINIAPLEMNNPYNEGKSELKIFESALVKVPSVVSAVHSYSQCIENEVNGYLAKNEDDWYKYLSELINNKEKREIIGQKAYDDFVQRFYICNEIDNVIKIYENSMNTEVLYE